MFPNKADNEIAAKDPRPGDYWNEMFSPVCLVVRRTDDKVYTYEKPYPVDKGHWTWDQTYIGEYTLEEFEQKLSYKSIPGYWCDVDRNKMKQFVEHYEESLK
jgi:hypothetical protein